MADGESLKKITEVFNRASIEIFNQMTGLLIKQGETTIKRGITPSFEYSLIVEVAGQYKGSVIMSLKKETALFLASSMLGKRADIMDEMTESALKELINISVGQALTISGSEKPLDITPPAIVKGDKISLPAGTDTRQTCVTSFITGGGVVEFTISLEYNR